MWIAKSANGGFPSLLLWPTPELKSGAYVKRKRKKRRRAKASKLVSTVTKLNYKANPELAKPFHDAAGTLGTLSL